jgi:hypothetical protein
MGYGKPGVMTQACGPATFSRARAAAMAMARGCEGDYVARDAVCELNGLQAMLDDRFFIPNESDKSRSSAPCEPAQ